MAQFLLVAALVLSFSVPALAAKRQYDRASPDDCRVVNIAPSYAQTTIRRGKRVYITRPTSKPRCGHYLQTRGGMAIKTAPTEADAGQADTKRPAIL